MAVWRPFGFGFPNHEPPHRHRVRATALLLRAGGRSERKRRSHGRLGDDVAAMIWPRFRTLRLGFSCGVVAQGAAPVVSVIRRTAALGFAAGRGATKRTIWR